MISNLGHILYSTLSKITLWTTILAANILIKFETFTYASAIFVIVWWWLMLTMLQMGGKQRTKVKRKENVHSTSVRSLPYDWMVLSSYMLSAQYMGHIHKLGYHQKGFLYVLRRLGRNFILLLLLFSRAHAHHARKPMNKKMAKTDWEPADAKFMARTDWESADANIPCTCCLGEKVDLMHNQAAHAFSFETTKRVVEFGMDNCCTHHVCRDKSLFVNDIRPIPDGIQILGVGGFSKPEGIGTIKMTIKDSRREDHNIILDNVYFVPEAPKNLISISQWSRDQADDCAIISRGKYSTFMWGGDKFQKSIPHSPECSIPLMLVNEGELHEVALPANLTYKQAGPKTTDQSGTNQQLVSDPRLAVGSLVKYLGPNGRHILCQIIHRDPKAKRYEIRVLNSDEKLEADFASLEPFNDTSPLDLPSRPEDIDINAVNRDITHEDLYKIWRPSATENNKDAIIAYKYWHNRLAHPCHTTMQKLAKKGIIPGKLAAIKKAPPCAACIFAKAHKRAWRTSRSEGRAISRRGDLSPGQGTSCDHIISKQPGLLPQVTGNPTNKRYGGAAVFVDHYSRHAYVHLMQSTSNEETLEAKLAYERLMHAHGHDVRAYHADNLRFNSEAYQEDCHSKRQTYSYCGVGAHHQNGIAESMNKILTESARILLLHAKRQWPKVISTVLWPYALKMACELHNKLDLDDSLCSPLQKLTQSTDSVRADYFHTWGCPVYVLDARNQSNEGGGTPKWSPKSRVGVYLGHSPVHAGSVALVLNLQTGHISPQYHVVFDDNFDTVPYLSSNEIPPVWAKLCQDQRELATDEQYDLANSWYEGGGQSNTGSAKGRDEMREDLLGAQQLETLGLRRSSRIKALKDAELAESSNQPQAYLVNIVQDIPKKIHVCFQAQKESFSEYLEQNLDGTYNRISIIGQMFVAGKTNNETYTFKEMLKQPDKIEFLRAMKKEVQAMFDDDIWEKVPRSEMLAYYKGLQKQGIDAKRKMLMLIWSFKRKRKPDGRISKYKARLCCHGGQQQWGVNYYETYAPVVAWASVRTMFVISKLFKLHTRSIDFVMAYPQAEIKTNIYLHPPDGIMINNQGEDLVLKLRKNLYGLKDAGRTWWECLAEGLKDLGFRSTDNDQCVWKKKGIIVIVYVDDCLIFGRSEKDVKKVSDEIGRKFVITDEGETIQEYLGVKITHNDDGSFRMYQPYLIERIIKSIPGMEKANPHVAPSATTFTLNKGEGTPERKEKWNYRSIVGMLNYLVNSTHPEIAYCVHQCARFCENPKSCHEAAIKSVIRYLLSTTCQEEGQEKEYGIMVKPDLSKGLEVYVDASFAGDWDKHWSEDSASTYSRTGYVIKYANCPIIWASRLQTEIALSTTESEYIALSTAMREVLPLMELMREIHDAFEGHVDCRPGFKCTAFEDNNGCIELAKCPKMRPRTKHIGTKYHHFRSKVEEGIVKVLHIGTEDQQADVFTKGLPRDKFLKFRKLICGW